MTPPLCPFHVTRSPHEVYTVQKALCVCSEIACTRASGGAEEDIVVGVVEGVEDLCLNGVEEVEAAGVEGLVGGVAQGGAGQRLQVEQLGGRRELLGQQQVAEGDGQLGVGGEPAVADEADEVLGRQRLADGHEELERVLVLGVLLLEQEELVVEDELGVDVLDEQPEGLGAAVHLLVPLEVGLDEQLDLEGGARDRQDVHGQLELGQLVDVLVDELAELGRAHQLADLVRLHVVEPLPRDVSCSQVKQAIVNQSAK